MSFQIQNRVLAGLPPSDYALLAPSLRRVTLPPGVHRHQHGLPLDHVYFPHDGVMLLLAITPEGRTIEMASAGRQGAVGPITRSDASNGLVVAIGTQHASQISTARLQAVAAESEAVNRALSACREALLLQVQQNLLCSGLHSLEQRISRWLLETAHQLESLTIPVTQAIVAQCLGVRRTSVTLVARKLQEIGAVRWGRSRVEILDHARLEPEACSRRRSESLSAHLRDLSERAQQNLGT
jgi:CRP-like cAMP-binding protein